MTVKGSFRTQEPSEREPSGEEREESWSGTRWLFYGLELRGACQKVRAERVAVQIERREKSANCKSSSSSSSPSLKMERSASRAKDMSNVI